MFRYYKEMKWIISVIIIILDGIIVFYMPSFFNQLNYFYPMFTVSLIPFLDDEYRTYYKMVFIFGLLYDVLYSNIFLFHALVFLLLAIIDREILKYWKNNLLLFLILIVINIFVYDLISFFLVLLTNYQVITISDLFYKIYHSLILNVLSGFVYFFLFKKKKFLHKLYW